MNPTLDPCCNDQSCWALPPEFVRLRYFYGQRLGVMELTDQAAYHAGKQAFHNVRAHGFGVVCGLRVERFVHPQLTGPKTTLLRVTRGAALDPCGREVLVGTDQCIDLKAWFAKNRARPALAALGAGVHAFVVAVRARDCPSDPMPAPRDTCACEPTGCEMGRVREAFELGLFTPEEAADVVAGPVYPEAQALWAALGAGTAGGVAGLDRAVDELLAASCPAPPEREWLALARFDLELTAGGTGTPEATDVLPEPDNAPPERHSLLPTWALQALLLQSVAGTGAAELAPGPRWRPLTLTGDSGGAVELTLAVALAQGGTPPVDVPLADATFDPASVQLHLLDPGTSKWTPVTFTAALDAATSTVRVKLPSITEDVPHRLVIEPPFATPFVDRAMRPVAPLRLSRDFRAVKDGAGPALRLAPVL